MGCILLIGILGCIFIAPWQAHISMNKDQHAPLGRGNFDKFINEFNKYNEWETNEKFRESFFGAGNSYHNRYYIHADIIKFDDKCMTLGLISYWKFKRWSKKEWNKRNPMQTTQKFYW